MKTAARRTRQETTATVAASVYVARGLRGATVAGGVASALRPHGLLEPGAHGRTSL